MKLNRNLLNMLFTLLFVFCVGKSYAQSCKKAFWSAQEQYKSGRFESAQQLLNACIIDFNGSNKNYYLENEDQVFKVYKLYIDSCNKAYNSALADQKKEDLIDYFSKKYIPEVVIEKLNSASF